MVADEAYDVIVAGAGVAGCLAARDLSRAGWRVAMIDPRAGDELGHDWWDTVDAEVFDEAGLARPEPPELMQGYHFRVFSPQADTGITAVMPETKLNIDRKLFGARLLGEALEAGVEFHARTRALGPVLRHGRVVGVEVEPPDGGRRSWASKLAVDASGIGGALRAGMGSGHGFDTEFDPADTVVTYREIREDFPPGGRSILVVGAHDGAQWVSRDQPGEVDFFVGVMDRPGRADPVELLAELVRTENRCGPERRRGGVQERIPVRRAYDSLVAPGLMLCGDSACMAHPLNGSGVSSALRAASMAARTADRALSSGSVETADLWPYCREYQSTQGLRFAKLHALQRLVYAEPREHFHLVLSRGVFGADSFWEIERQLDPVRGLEKLPKVLSLADRPGFLARLGLTLLIVGAVELHYSRYPRSYEPRRFNAWRRTAQRLFDLVPQHGNGNSN